MKHKILSGFLCCLVLMGVVMSFTTPDQRRQFIWDRVMADGTPNKFAGWDANGEPTELDGAGLGGTMAANQVAFGLDANNLTSDPDFTFNGSAGSLSVGGSADPFYRLSSSGGVTTDYKAGSIVSNSAPFIIDMSAGFSLEGSSMTLNASGTDITLNAADDLIFDPTDDININSDVVLAPTTSASHLFQSTYTPTLGNTLNITSTLAFECHYARIGNMVIVSGLVQATPTAGANTDSSFSMTLPIASNLGLTSHCTGNAGAINFNLSTAIIGDQTNDIAVFRFLSPGTTVINFYFTFTYRVI